MGHPPPGLPMSLDAHLARFTDLASVPREEFRAAAWAVCDELRRSEDEDILDPEEVGRPAIHMGFSQAAMSECIRASRAAGHELTLGQIDDLSSALANIDAPMLPQSLGDWGKAIKVAARAIFKR